MRRLSSFFLIAMLMQLNSGCTSKVTDAPTGDVTGKVTIDGQPLEEGRIVFTPPGGGVPAAGDIKNGTYSVKARTGKNSVAITAYKIDPSIKPSNDPVRPVDNKVNYIPKQFNTNTTLSADVTAEKGSFDFQVTSK